MPENVQGCLLRPESNEYPIERKMPILFEHPRARRPCSCCNLSTKAATLTIAFGNIVISAVLGIYAGFALAYLEPLYMSISTFLGYAFDINALAAAHAFLFFFTVMHVLFNLILFFAAKSEWKLLCKLWIALTILECMLAIMFFMVTSILVHALLGVVWILIVVKNSYFIFLVLYFIKDLDNYHRTEVAIPGIGKIGEKSMGFRTTKTIVMTPGSKEFHQKKTLGSYQPTSIFRNRNMDLPNDFGYLPHDGYYNHRVRWVALETDEREPQPLFIQI